MLFERRTKPPATRARFRFRLAGHATAASGLMAKSLGAGMVFILAVGIIGAPLIHRLQHKFHWAEYGRDGTA